MSGRISAHIASQRKSIRRTQIDSLISTKRNLMSKVDESQALQALTTHLLKIKQFAIYEAKDSNFTYHLSMLHSIAASYNVINLLIDDILPSSCPLFAMKYQASGAQEFTWLDLLLEFIKVFAEDLIILEQCSAILAISARYLKSQMPKSRYNQRKSQMERQLMRLYQHYPYQLLSQGSSETIGNSLSFVCQVVLSCRNGTAIYHLLNHSHIVSLLNGLIEKGRVLEQKKVKSEFLNTATILIFFIARYNLVKLVLKDYNQMVDSVKKMFFTEFGRCDTKEQFGNICIKFDLLIASNMIPLDNNELDILEGMIERELRNCHQPFFSMMANLLRSKVWQLKPQSLKLILNGLFSTLSQPKIQADLKFDLLAIFQKHVINCGNHFRPEDIEMFIHNWGQYSQVDRLINLLQQLDTADKSMANLCYLIEMIVQGHGLNILKEVVAIHSDQLTELMSYPQLANLLDPEDTAQDASL